MKTKMMNPQNHRLDKMANRFKVGQIVYILMPKNHAVMPARIIAENKQKTLKGLNVTYDAIMGPAEESKQFVVNETNKESVFDSPKKVQQYLTAEATSSIAGLVAHAEKTAKEWYADAEQPVADEDDEDKQADSQPAVSQKELKEGQIRLDDGTVANVKFSEPRDG